MISLLASFGGALISVLSLFNPFKQSLPPAKKRNHKRLNLQHLIKKCKKGSTQHSVYRKILTNRLSQQLRQSKKNSTKTTNQPSKPTNIVKPKKKVHHKKQHKSASIIHRHPQQPRSRSFDNKAPASPPTILRNECVLQTPSYVISQNEIYAPSAPLWTPPPSPRRGSLPDINLAVSYPPHAPTVIEYPHLLSEGFLLSPASSSISSLPTSPFPTAPPAEAFPFVYPTLEQRFLQPANSASPPFSSPLTLRRHFAQYYIPQVKTNIPYVRSSSSTSPPFSRPAPFAPTELNNCMQHNEVFM